MRQYYVKLFNGLLLGRVVSVIARDAHATVIGALAACYRMPLCLARAYSTDTVMHHSLQKGGERINTSNVLCSTWQSIVEVEVGTFSYSTSYVLLYLVSMMDRITGSKHRNGRVCACCVSLSPPGLVSRQPLSHRVKPIQYSIMRHPLRRNQDTTVSLVSFIHYPLRQLSHPCTRLHS